MNIAKMDEIPSVAMTNAELESEIRELKDKLQVADVKVYELTSLVVSGKLSGALPDGFLEMFFHLPEKPLEHILRYLPTKQLIQMRSINRYWNKIITKASASMPKIQTDADETFALEETDEGKLIARFYTKDFKFRKRELQSRVSLSDQLRFISIQGHLLFKGQNTVSERLLREMQKPFLSIRPKTVAFSDNLHMATSASLRDFLARVSPYMKRLLFQEVLIADGLVTEGVIRAAGPLKVFMMQPSCPSLPATGEGSAVQNDEFVSMAEKENGQTTVDFSDDSLRAVDISYGCIVLTDCPKLNLEAFCSWIEDWCKREELIARKTGNGATVSTALSLYQEVHKRAKKLLAVKIRLCDQLTSDSVFAELAKIPRVFVSLKRTEGSSVITVKPEPRTDSARIKIRFETGKRVMENMFVRVPHGSVTTDSSESGSTTDASSESSESSTSEYDSDSELENRTDDYDSDWV